jgi:hypothetical protein
VYNELRTAAEKSAFPSTVSGLWFFGIQLGDWVFLFTMLYLLLQIIYIIKKIFTK